jgi:hypothetical protein
MQRKSLIAVALAQAGLLSCLPLREASPADAIEDRPSVSFAAFGTLSVVHSDEDQADFVRSMAIPRGAGASTAWASDVDSLAGGQLTVTAGPRLSAEVQVVAEHRYDNSYSPHVEWANLKYEFTPDFAVRAGRIALPIFMFTDLRRVGFALPWVRTPQEVYELVPVTSNDGIDLTWNRQVGAGRNTFQLAMGRSNTPFERNRVGYDAKTSDQFVAADTYDLGDLSLRVNYGQAHFTMDLYRPLFDAFRQLAALGGQAIADRYELDGRMARYMGVSASYQPGTWFAMGELGRLGTDALIGNRVGWYVSAGRQFGAFTPYLTYGALRLTSNTSDPGLPVLPSMPPSLAASIATLDATLNGVLASAPRQSTATAGVRFDVMRNLAIKAQFDHIDLKAGSSGTLANVQPGFRPGGALNLISLSLDFVL